MSAETRNRVHAEKAFRRSTRRFRPYHRELQHSDDAEDAEEAAMQLLHARNRWPGVGGLSVDDMTQAGTPFGYRPVHPIWGGWRGGDDGGGDRVSASLDPDVSEPLPPMRRWWGDVNKQQEKSVEKRPPHRSRRRRRRRRPQRMMMQQLHKTEEQFTFPIPVPYNVTSEPYDVPAFVHVLNRNTGSLEDVVSDLDDHSIRVPLNIPLRLAGISPSPSSSSPDDKSPAVFQIFPSESRSFQFSNNMDIKYYPCGMSTTPQSMDDPSGQRQVFHFERAMVPYQYYDGKDDGKDDDSSSTLSKQKYRFLQLVHTYRGRRYVLCVLGNGLQKDMPEAENHGSDYKDTRVNCHSWHPWYGGFDNCIGGGMGSSDPKQMLLGFIRFDKHASAAEKQMARSFFAHLWFAPQRADSGHGDPIGTSVAIVGVGDKSFLTATAFNIGSSDELQGAPDGSSFGIWSITPCESTCRGPNHQVYSVRHGYPPRNMEMSAYFRSG